MRRPCHDISRQCNPRIFKKRLFHSRNTLRRKNESIYFSGFSCEGKKPPLFYPVLFSFRREKTGFYLMTNPACGATIGGQKSRPGRTGGSAACAGGTQARRNTYESASFHQRGKPEIYLRQRKNQAHRHTGRPVPGLRPPRRAGDGRPVAAPH